MKINPFQYARRISDAPEEKIFPSSFRFLFSWIARGVALFIPLVWIASRPATLASLIGFIVAYVLTMLAVGLPGTLFLTWVTRVRVTAAGIHGGTF